MIPMDEKKEELTPRQKGILTRIIESHIATTLPVGSKTLAERYGLTLSPASVRHEMGVLEEQGYLTHPHPSAGRVPTDKGYRFYVTEGVTEEPVPPRFLDLMAREMEGKIEDLESLMGRVSRILSGVAEEAALLILPKLQGMPRLFVEGSRYILNQPEFQDLKKIQLLIAALEERSNLIELLMDQPQGSEVHVAIGAKDLSKNIWDCSLVSAPYIWREKYIGAVGILGPRRMPYGRIMGLVHRMADEISQALGRWGS